MDKKEIQEYLIKKLDESYFIKKSDVKYDEVASSRTLLEIRDKLINIGLIIEEKLEERFYLVDIKVGLAGATSAHTAMLINEGTIYIATYAKEGIIKQHLSEKAIDKIIEAVK